MNFTTWFKESSEDETGVIKIKLGNWGTSKKPSSVTPEEFINMFNNEMGAKRFENKFYYFDKIKDGEEALVQYSMKPFGGEVYVSDLQVEPRGLAAIKFLIKLTKLADQHNITLSCYAKPLDVDNKVEDSRLKNLYMRFGFLPVKSRGDMNLKRTPN